jgi:hypothetical protein
MAVDASGNVFITGYSTSAGLSFDYATIKYSSSGVPLWTNRYGGPGVDNRATALALDTGGNVFVTGYSTNSTSGYDYATICYSSVGVPLWTNRYDGPSGGDDTAEAVVVDNNGNVLVTGSSTTITYAYNYLHFATVKYSNAGVPLWTNRYAWPTGDNDIASAIAADASGNVFVAGYSSYFSGGGTYYETVEYSGDGTLLWTNRSSVGGVLRAMALDGNGGLVLTGYSSPPGEDYLTIKYSLPQPPWLLFQKENNQLILSWTNAAFALQAAPTLAGTFTNIPGAASPFTNTAIGAQRFFRLISN